MLDTLRIKGSGAEEVNRYYYHPDHLGSTSYITNSDGEVCQHVEYIPFGETLMEEHLNSEVSPYLFNGKERDKETGFYYYGARYYDPKISLWLGVDPLAVYDPVNETEYYFDGQHNGGAFYFGNLNPYVYCYQNPVKFVDPNGKQTLKINGESVKDSRGEILTKAREATFAIFYSNAAGKIGWVEHGGTNISSVSGRFARHVAENGNMRVGISTERNAIRHVIFSSFIRREFDLSTAEKATNVHEGIGISANVEVYSYGPFNGDANFTDTMCDLLNNRIGFKIAEENQGLSNVDLVKEILKKFKEEGFYIGIEQEKGKFRIQLHKISNQQYNKALETLNTLNENGFTFEEQVEIIKNE